MSLQFLDFEYSEDPQGGGSFDAMASVRPVQLAEVRAEITEVLDWAKQRLRGSVRPSMRAVSGTPTCRSTPMRHHRPGMS